MKIGLTRGSWKQITATFDWTGAVDYNPSTHKFTFFATKKPKNHWESSYTEVEELQKYLSDFFVFDFYTEEGVDKVMFSPKEDCWITFK